jgi:hypothetical protein
MSANIYFNDPTEPLFQPAQTKNPLANRETKTSSAKLSRVASTGEPARESSIDWREKRAWKLAQPAVSAKRTIGAILAGVRPSLWHVGLILHALAAVLAGLYLLGIIAFGAALLYHTFIH